VIGAAGAVSVPPARSGKRNSSWAACRKSDHARVVLDEQPLQPTPDLLDAFCYGIALALGNGEGF
jgi:hypothetical protein